MEKQRHNRSKRTGCDWLFVFLAVLLLLAMALTLVFAKGRSRHGYGLIPLGQNSVQIALHPGQGSPCRIG